MTCLTNNLTGRAAALAVVVLIATAPARAWQDELPEIDHYRWGFPIATTERASFYTVRLPYDIYASAGDARLRDLSVFNASGQPVPRVIEADVAEIEETETRRTLPFAALFRDVVPEPDRVRLIFEQRAGETVLDLRSDASGDGKIRPPLTGYIVDTRNLDGGADRLELTWAPLDQGFVGRLQVDASNDLVNWSMIGSGAIADLRENATEIVKRRVSISAGNHDFLRLTWSGVPNDWRLDRLDALQLDSRSSINREWLTLADAGQDEVDGGRLFNAIGPVPVDRVNLALPESNSVVRARIYYRLPGRANWALAHHGTFYNVRRGELPATSGAEAISLARAAEWKVVVSGGRPDTPMELELGWRPDTLLFVAQGDMPFTVATGRDSAEAEGFPENRLLGDVSLGGIATDNGPVARATLGARYGLAAVERSQPLDVRTLLLWGVLIVAVLFVGWMALRLSRGLSSE